MKTRRIENYEIDVNDEGIVERIMLYTQGESKMLHPYLEEKDGFVRRFNMKFTTMKSYYYKGKVIFN